MNYNSEVRWNKTGSYLSIKLNLNKSCKIKGDLSNTVGKCIMNMFDKPFEKGSHSFIKKIRKIKKGIYTMKISTYEGCNVIRFMID